ncbi:hypothetical protein SELMODRAFT_268500 [Selaginella moellendorffii]|uniref:Metalloenzyme domain-containing protein n=2 Tax=Selaginella moellendorffii TaxID=88036 RepID=D8SES7_SELML|nr:hypothetical protein SELMODRAFT_268500 [Selaginella moellendorffii]
MSMRRVAFVLVDGIGDVSIPELGWKTPLEAASTPNLDAIATAGISGLMDPVEPGLACGSDTAHLSLLGYDPRQYYRGRGAFESLGAGLAMSPGDIAFKSNFATMDDGTGVVTCRRADRHFEEDGPIFCAALDGLKLPSFPAYEVRVRYATEHRCGVVVKGPGLSGNISGTDPLKDNRLLEVVVPLDESDEAKHTAAVVNELSLELRRILSDHPLNAKRQSAGKAIANVVLLRGCGIRIQVPSFNEKHGLRSCMVAPTKIIAGLGLSLDIAILDAPGATGDYRTLLTSKANAIAKALAAPLERPPNVFVPGEDDAKPGWSEGYDFGFLHIKAIDDAGHDKAVKLKKLAFEAVDKMIGQLARMLWEAECRGAGQFSLCVTGDHSTPVEYGDHSFEPVPFTICHLKDFVKTKGEDTVLSSPLEAFRLPGTTEDSSWTYETHGPKPCDVHGDGVTSFSELSAARGVLGRFPGSEMMGIIKKYMQLDTC